MTVLETEKRRQNNVTSTRPTLVDCVSALAAGEIVMRPSKAAAH
jgi:hypothetical protein